ncbi:hypothetical protein ACFOS0_12675 [Nocardia seriolae]|uniref:hypothetical protein n=1 Tax=Nocardia seriolae TaxID=37332 RepID=UPI00117DEEB3|nr:hypothetical protein [Nocardia seriolae]MTJ74051.1 hypothetical protein [Nocardia seriolae]MTJ84529.1 hypothetical protein [Nocardia seriolae]MTK45094.1 hypothetical protein [Nocardia seriolae]MTL10137.1 hypothetical protein [Nocardia seriolae]
MNPAPASLRRRSIRLYWGVLFTSVAIVMGLTAAIAGWGSSQRISLLESNAPTAVTADYAQATPDSGRGQAVDLVPSCRKQERPASDPTGTLAVPPRAIGDQLVADCFAIAPEFTTPQRFSLGKQPRAPTLPVAAPHLTAVLII